MAQGSKYLTLVVSDSNYVVCWSIAESSSQLMRTCETFVKLICRCSLLRSDDCRLCANCDKYMVEGLKHIVMQCEYTSQAREHMFEEIFNAIKCTRTTFADNPSESSNWLIEKTVPDLYLGDNLGLS